MKYTLAAATASVLLAGCERSSNERPSFPRTNAVHEMRKQTNETVDAAKARLTETKEQFVAATQEQLHQLDQKLAELGAKAETLKDDAKAEANKALATLREQRVQLGQKFDELQKSSQEAWKDVKAGFDAAYAELEKAYDNAKGKFTN